MAKNSISTQNLRRHELQGLVFCLLALLIILGPPSLAVGGIISFLKIIAAGTVGALIGAVVGRMRASRDRIHLVVLGIGAGIVIYLLDLTDRGSTEDLSTTYLIIGIAAGLAGGIEASALFNLSKPIDYIKSSILACLPIFVGIPALYFFVPSRFTQTKGIYLFITCLTAFIFCNIGLLSITLSSKIFDFFSEIGLYLREMSVYLLSFFIIYFAIAMVFGSWYWAIWILNPNYSFNNIPPNAKFSDFMYFSFTTITTLGYGDITPQSEIAKLLTYAEAVIGIGWITVVFATILTTMQPRFNILAARIAKTESGNNLSKEALIREWVENKVTNELKGNGKLLLKGVVKRHVTYSLVRYQNIYHFAPLVRTVMGASTIECTLYAADLSDLIGETLELKLSGADRYSVTGFIDHRMLGSTWSFISISDLYIEKSKT